MDLDKQLNDLPYIINSGRSTNTEILMIELPGYRLFLLCIYHNDFSSQDLCVGLSVVESSGFVSRPPRPHC